MIRFAKLLLLSLFPILTQAQQIDTSLVADLKKKAHFFDNDLQKDSAKTYYLKVADIYRKYQLKALYYEAFLKGIKQGSLAGDYKKLKQVALETLKKIDSELPNHRTLKASYYDFLGTLEWNEEKDKQSIDWYDKGLKLVGKDQKSMMVRLSLWLGKGNSLNSLGKFKESDELYEKGVELLEQKFSKSSKKANEMRVSYYKNLIANKVSTREFDKGLEAGYKGLQYLQLLSLSKKRYFHKQGLLFNQAICYKLKKSYLKSIEAYRACIQLQKKVDPEDFGEMGNYVFRLGRAYLAQSKLDSALYYHQKAIDYLLKEYEATHIELATPYYGLGYVYTRQKKHKLANKYYAKSLNSLAKKYGEIHPNLVLLYNYMASNSYMLKKYQATLNYQHKALMSNTRNFRDHNVFVEPPLDDYYNSLLFYNSLRGKGMSLGRLQGNIKYTKASLAHFKLADTFMKKFRKGVSRKSDQILAGHYIYALVLDVIRTCESLYIQTGDKKYLEKAFYFAEREKASFLLSALAEANAKKFGKIPSSLLSSELRLRQKIARYQSSLALGKGNSLRDSLLKLNQTYEKLTKRLEQSYPKYARLKFDLRLATPADIQASIDDQTALLEYTFCRESVYLMVITKKHYEFIRIPEIKKVRNQLDAYYEAIQSESRLKKFVPISHRLYQYLIQPAKKHLNGIKKLVVVAPSLESAPLEALVTELPKDLNQDDFSRINYLNNQYQISYHYSATLWQKEVAQAIKQRPNMTLRFVGFAPFSTGESKIYATRRGASGHLPESGVEVKSIYNLFRQQQLNAEVSLAKTATKELFMQKIGKAHIVHVASHSEANTKMPGLAKVRFSGCGEDEKEVSGCLLASEIYNLEVNADLLVLSSCSSGVGKFTKGEGVFSLARSFLYAGAHNVVFSLWDIDDQYTKELMVAFYKYFLATQNNEGYQKALQMARSQLIKQNTHPKHWAGIVLIGK